MFFVENRLRYGVKRQKMIMNLKNTCFFDVGQQKTTVCANSDEKSLREH